LPTATGLPPKRPIRGSKKAKSGVSATAASADLTGRIRAFFPGKKAAKKPVGDAAWTQQQIICACHLNVARRASGHKKSLKIAEKQACLFYREFSGFSLCALRTAWPASLACPEAVGALLFQIVFAAFTATNGVSLLLSLTQREKSPVRILPLPIPVCRFHLI